MCEQCEIIDEWFDVERLLYNRAGMDAAELREHLDVLGMPLDDFAQLFGCAVGRARRYVKGSSRIPLGIASEMRWLRLNGTDGHA